MIKKGEIYRGEQRKDNNVRRAVKKEGSFSKKCTDGLLVHVLIL